MHWQMVQIKHFTALQKMLNFQFSRRANWPWRDKILSFPELGQKIIVNQRKAIWVVFSIKPSGKITGHAKLIGRFLLRPPLNSRKPKCDIHGHFSLIFGNRDIFLLTWIRWFRKSLLPSSIFVKRWHFRTFHYDVIIQIRCFLSFNNFKLNITEKRFEITVSVL